MFRPSNLTAERLKQQFHYDPLTGVFTRLTGPRGVGAPSGYVHSRGYVHISVEGVEYKAHRLAWLYMTGEWPLLQIDHEDTVRSNNVWTNLRLATRSQNQGNSRPIRKTNTSGFKGVSRHPQNQKWVAYINRDGQSTYLGSYDNINHAAAAYRAAALQAFGQFSRTS